MHTQPLKAWTVRIWKKRSLIAKLVSARRTVWELKGAPFWTDVFYHHTGGGNLSSLPLRDPCNQGAEILHASGLSYRLNSASLHPWPIDGSSAFQSALFCFAVHFLSLLIDFPLLLSFWGSHVPHPILTLVCVHFWDHSEKVLCALLFPFRCSLTFARVHGKYHYSLVS